MLLLVLFLSSSLRSLIEKAPITGKEFIPLSGSALTGFRLHPGPVSCIVYASAGFLLHCFSIFVKIPLAFCCTGFFPLPFMAFRCTVAVLFSSCGCHLHCFFSSSVLLLHCFSIFLKVLGAFCCTVFLSGFPLHCFFLLLKAFHCAFCLFLSFCYTVFLSSVFLWHCSSVFWFVLHCSSVFSLSVALFFCLLVCVALFFCLQSFSCTVFLSSGIALAFCCSVFFWGGS